MTYSDEFLKEFYYYLGSPKNPALVDQLVWMTALKNTCYLFKVSPVFRKYCRMTWSETEAFENDLDQQLMDWMRRQSEV